MYRRIRQRELWELRFKCLQFGKKRVVLSVRDFGAIQGVIKVIVSLDDLGEFSNAFFSVGFVHGALKGIVFTFVGKEIFVMNTN